MKRSPFPKYDFRTIVENPNSTDTDIVCALLMEPLSQIFEIWENRYSEYCCFQRNKVEYTRFLGIFQRAISSAIAMNRCSPITDLYRIQEYPDLYSSVLKGCNDLWNRLYCRMYNDVIILGEGTLDSYPMTVEDKQILLSELESGFCFVKDGTVFSIHLSNLAYQLYMLINCFKSLVETSSA